MLTVGMAAVMLPTNTGTDTVTLNMPVMCAGADGTVCIPGFFGYNLYFWI